MFIPAKYFEVIIYQIVEAAGMPEFAVQQGLAVANCVADWKPIKFMMENHWVQIDPEEYLVDVSQNGDGSACLFMMIAY